MATKTPRVDRECLCCGTHFGGTPKATRCPTCREAGLKVPSAKQAARAKTRTCRTCDTKFTLDPENLDAQMCPSCADEIGNLSIFEVDPEVEAREREERRKARVVERLARQAEYLDNRETKPKGRKAMTTTTAKLPIGLWWLEVCHHDGAAHTMTYLGDSTDLTEEDRITLLTTYLRLRVKRHRPEALAKLCPIALLKDETQAAIADLPQVSDADADDLEFDPLEGNECLRRELDGIADRQDRRNQRITLGLEPAPTN